MPAPPPTAAPADEASRHYRDSLARALGPEVLAALAEADVTEVYVNPSGHLTPPFRWLESNTLCQECASDSESGGAGVRRPERRCG